MIFKEEFKKEMVRKLLLPGSKGASALSDEIGVSPQTLYNWRDRFSEIKSLVSTSDLIPRNWKPAARLKAIFDTACLAEIELGRWLRENGLQKEHLEIWKKEIMDLTKSDKYRVENRGLKRENLELKRELARKDKALAEVSALLILKKKAALLFQQEKEK